MNLNHQNTVTAALLKMYGDALNLRGLIFGPPEIAACDGRVSFNVIDSRHSDFGRHMWHYAIDTQGNVQFFRDNIKEERRDR